MSRIVCVENDAQCVRGRRSSVECGRAQSRCNRAVHLDMNRENDALDRCTTETGLLKIGAVLAGPGRPAVGRALRILGNEVIWIAVQVSRYLEFVLIALGKFGRSRSASVWTVTAAA